MRQVDHDIARVAGAGAGLYALDPVASSADTGTWAGRPLSSHLDRRPLAPRRTRETRRPPIARLKMFEPQALQVASSSSKRDWRSTEQVAGGRVPRRCSASQVQAPQSGDRLGASGRHFAPCVTRMAHNAPSLPPHPTPQNERDRSISPPWEDSTRQAGHA
jgi:hypothetical protein